MLLKVRTLIRHFTIGEKQILQKLIGNELSNLGYDPCID